MPGAVIRAAEAGQRPGCLGAKQTVRPDAGEAVGALGVQHALQQATGRQPAADDSSFVHEAVMFGRLLTDVAVERESRYDLSAFRLDRRALTDPYYVANWMM